MRGNSFRSRNVPDWIAGEFQSLRQWSDRVPGRLGDESFKTGGLAFWMEEEALRIDECHANRQDPTLVRMDDHVKVQRYIERQRDAVIFTNLLLKKEGL